MIKPMPFCPSFEPCAKLTPVHVKIRIANPPRRRRRALPAPVQPGFLSTPSSPTGAAPPPETDQRRYQQREADREAFSQSTPPAPPLSHQLVREPDAEDRSDQRVRTRRGKAKGPRAQVPDD